MINITVWNEFQQEQMDVKADIIFKNPDQEGLRNHLKEGAKKIKELHPGGIHETLKSIFDKEEDLNVRTATLDMPECGLTKEVLDETDVLVWWSHIAHDKVPDEIALRVKDYVLRGMGFIALHSSHQCKPLQFLVGTSGSLRWRENDFCRVWNVNPSHPIAQGVPEYVELPVEEMYGEPFDIGQPDEIVFISWFRGGEVMRSGCTWKRGYGNVFYFQPGHETNKAYFNEHIQQILVNAVRWAKPVLKLEKIECPNVKESPESKYTS